MPQIHSTTQMSADSSALNSSQQQPEGIDALFASILAIEKTSESSDGEANVDVSKQFHDQLEVLVEAPLEETSFTSPEELLQQIGHSVSFNTELNKNPEQNLQVGGELLPQTGQNIAADTLVSDADILVDESTVASELESITDIEVSLVSGTTAVGITSVNTASATATNTEASLNTINPTLQSTAKPNATLNTEGASADDIAVAIGVDDVTESVEAEIDKDTKKPAITPEVLVAKNDAKRTLTEQKNIESQSIKLGQPSSEEIQVDSIQDIADSIDSVEKSTTKSSPLNFGQSNTLFAGNERLDAKTDVPRLNVSLKQGAEPQAQMQDMIQRFAPVMKQQVMAMVNNGMGQAEIRLDPPELGHMMVRIQVQNDQTQVQFQVANPAARELLEQATPRLRDMLAEQGMNLADSEVSYHNGGNNERGNQGDDGEAGSSRNAYADSAIEAEEVSLINIAADQSSGIDYYA
ncbi:flagellar hook-length control protein FliK [Shewanella sp. 202IG2-18]|uniref:flagellar hook-length control protein FliK n=1 Tax=Parashewanella hymeniacidonis TaxID=2807618 RepID=UPI001960EEA2|nr:flagellar hook-length control protein FliK [Parashewanella hymeniacidonis]